MAFSSKAKSLLIAGPVSILMLIAAQEAVEAEPVVASYYGNELAGSPTATGEPFNPQGMTAAHPSLPLGTMLTVSYGGQSVNVRVNDRGPFVHGRGLDLSLGAAQRLGLTGPGTGVVDIKPAGATNTKPQATPSKPERPAESSPAASATTTTTTPSRQVQEIEEPEFLPEGALTPPGDRIKDLVYKIYPAPPQDIDADHSGSNSEEPSLRDALEMSEDPDTQDLHLLSHLSGRRRVL